MKTSLYTDSQIIGLWYENMMKKRGQPSIGQKRKINTLTGSNIFLAQKSINAMQERKKEKK